MKVVFDKLKPGDRFTLFSDAVYMKIDTKQDGNNRPFDINGRWPYRDSNAVNLQNGKLITVFESSIVDLAS